MSSFRLFAIFSCNSGIIDNSILTDDASCSFSLMHMLYRAVELKKMLIHAFQI